MSCRQLLFCATALICPLLSGCGFSEPIARLDCHVSLEGRPLEDAEVRFEQTGGKRVTIQAVSRADGSCYIDLGARKGIPAGDYKITVTRYELPDGRPLPAGEEGQMAKADGKARPTKCEFQKSLSQGRNTLRLKLEEGTPIVEEIAGA